MKLTSLLGHSSELLRIILKSHQPSDMIMSDYFRKKKYIGSTERRFLSELVFSVLRAYGLIEFCIISALNKSDQKSQFDNIDKDFLISVAGVFLFEKYDIFHKIIHPSKILEKFINNDNIFELLITSLSEKANIPESYSEEFCNYINSSFDELNAKSLQIKNLNAELQPGISSIISHRYSMPEWIIDDWLKNEFYTMSINEVTELSESLLFPAPLTLRVNLSYNTRGKILELLSEKEIEGKPCLYSPSGIIINKRVQLNNLDIFKKGFIEVQDEGSQLISYALDPHENDSILDACAGAGGKSLHIADIVKNSAKIFVNDIDRRKLRELKFRAKRARFSSIELLNHNSKKVSKNTKFQKSELLFDRVLVDAPCSGMGTVRRMPMQKWRLTSELLKKHSSKQLKILEYYSEFVREGGILIYSTCSLMSEENEELIHNFLKLNSKFKPLPLKPSFDRFNIHLPGLSNDSATFRLSPDKHGCDGFFMAKMIREE